MKHQLLFLALVASVFYSIAQPPPLDAKGGTIAGTLVDESNGQPVEYGTISVLSLPDSVLITGGISDMEGKFEIEAPFGKYALRIQFIAYETKEVADVSLTPKESRVDLGVIRLKSALTELEEVVVQAERTQMQLNLDKKVYNVGKDLSNLGGSASDMLSNLPSVNVDVDGNVQLRGSSNVRVLIDGKPSGLVGLSSSDALRQIPSNLIESVEIITNPSARYDAEGQAGIINIILKKEKQKGLNGSFTANTGYPHNHGASVNLNFRKKWVNFFVNYGVNYDSGPGRGNSYQFFSFQDTSYYTDQKQRSTRGGLSNNFRGGADFFVGKNTTLTTSFLYRYSDQENNSNLTFRDLSTDRELIDFTQRFDKEVEGDQNLEYALNLTRNFEQKDRKLTADFQVQDNFEVEKSDIDQFGAPQSENPVRELFQKTRNEEGERRMMLQSDYIHPFGEKSKAEVGFRSTFREIKNDILIQEQDDTGNLQVLENFSTDFQYNENVHAAYGIVSSELERISWQLGLRTEISDIQTNIKDSSLIKNYNYTNLFPSAFFTWKVDETSQLQLSYSRRINRPRFRDLNPLSSFTNNRNFRVGNPALQPEYTDSYEFGYLQNFNKSSIYYGIYHRHTEDLILRVSKPADENGNTYMVPENIGISNSFGVEVNANKDFSKWYRMTGNFNFYRQSISGSAFGEKLGSETVTFSTRLNNNFKIKKLMDAQLNINYRAPQKQPQGKQLSMTGIDIGMSRDIWNNNGTLSLSGRNVFNTMRFRSITSTPNYTSESMWQWRRGPLLIASLTYRLNQSKERQQRRSGGGEEFGEGEF